MQILMTEAALERVRGRMAAIAPDAEIVTVTGPGSYALNGQPIALEAMRPEAAWLSLDSAFSKLMGEISAPLLQLDSPKWVQVFAAGIDSPVFKAILARGVRLTRSSAQAIPIAEYVLAHALSLQVPLQAQAELQAAHKWKFTPYRELSRTHWVAVGYGSIGHEIARRIKPFGVELTVVRRSPAEDDLADRVIGLADLPTVLPDADVVVLACALNDETRGLADAAFFQALKPGAILINIGRGDLVDEDALRAGLDRDQPAHAVLDVFATEPLPEDSWFWDHPKVRVSGHTSNSGDGNADRGDELFLANLQRYIAGEPLLHEASPREVGL